MSIHVEPVLACKHCNTSNIKILEILQYNIVSNMKIERVLCLAGVGFENR